MDIYRAGFKYANFFFLRKKRGKNKDRKKRKRQSDAECPKDHAGGQDVELLSGTASWAPSARPGGLWLTRLTCVTRRFLPVPSVLRWVGGKSFCSMKLQRAGDTFSKRDFKISSYISRKPTTRLTHHKFLYNRNK